MEQLDMKRLRPKGFIAGVNAAFKSLAKKQIILERNESYIGVLIDDLSQKRNR